MRHDIGDLKYGEAALRARESFASKVKQELNKRTPDSGIKFLKLTQKIPNWETYLTVKQRESAHKYLQCMNAYEVDYQLKLSAGTTHQRLFGSKTSKGAIGRLEQVYKMLEEQGYFEEQQRKKEIAATLATTKPKPKLSQNSLSKFKELISLVLAMPDYEMYLSKSQKQIIFHFLRLRNLNSTAHQCDITVDSLKRKLIGKNGILEKLKEVQDNRTVSKWEEI